MNADASPDEPARNFRHHLVGLHAQSDDAAAVRLHVLPECGEPFEGRTVGSIDAHFHIERRLRIPQRHLVNGATLLHEHDAIAGCFHFAEQMGVEEHGRAPIARVFDQLAHQHPAERIEP